MKILLELSDLQHVSPSLLMKTVRPPDIFEACQLLKGYIPRALSFLMTALWVGNPKRMLGCQVEAIKSRKQVIERLINETIFFLAGYWAVDW